MKKNQLQEEFSFLEDRAHLPEVRPPFQPKQLFQLAAQGIYLGTSSWKYRGWEGMIYRGGYSSEAQFQRQSLREYTSYFPCVGVDFTYYTWPLPDMMNYLVESTPENFRLFPKVTKRITMREFPNIPMYGKWAGQKNPDFLDFELFESQFMKPIELLGSRLGALFFEFTTLDAADLPKFENFFQKISHQHPIGVEIRNANLANEKFYTMLAALQIGPILNSWTKMPMLREQWQAYRPLAEKSKLPIFVRGLLRPGRSYEEAVRLFQPYKQVQDVYGDMRNDVRSIINWAQQNERRAHVLINNRLEGSAPHTIGAILDSLSLGEQ